MIMLKHASMDSNKDSRSSDPEAFNRKANVALSESLENYF